MTHQTQSSEQTLTDIGIQPDRLTDPDNDPPTKDDIPGQTTDAATFAEGEMRLHTDRYVVKGASYDGLRIGTVVTRVIFEGYDISPDTDWAPDYLDLADYDYRVGDDELHLRRPPMNE